MRFLLNCLWLITLGWGVACWLSANYHVDLHNEASRQTTSVRLLMASTSFLLTLCILLLSCFI